MTDLGLGIKKFRMEKNLSLRQLAEKSGISLSQLSKIEAGKADTTVRNLLKIANVLNVPVAKIINETEPIYMLRPIRRGEGFAIGRQAAENSEIREIFLNMRPDAFMQPEVLYLPPDASSGEFLKHEGEEFFYVLKGHVRFHVSDQEYEMREGDSFYFNCTLPHKWLNLSADEWCELLICCSPPTFK